MEGFSDLLWLLIMFLVITRGLGAARKGKAPPQPPSSPDQPEQSTGTTETAVRRADRPGGRELSQDPRQPGPGQRARAGKRLDPVAEYRRRLMEAAREWEAEQRHRAGLPVEDQPETPSPRREATIDRRREASPPRARPSARPPSRGDRFGAGKDPRRPDAGRPTRRPSSWEARDVTPDRVPGPRPVREPERMATREEEPPPRVPGPRPERPAPARGPDAEPPTAGTSLTHGSAHEPLARLDRFQPLKRAVVLAEILGLPRAVADDPSSRGGRR